MWGLDRPVYLACEHVDMRKSIDGLSLLVSSHFIKNPADGALYVFCNRGRNKIKILYWDINGFCLWYKRLEKSRFCLPVHDGDVCILESRQLEWLLAGLDITKIKGHPRLTYSEFG